MIAIRNWEVYVSVIFYLFTKFLCFLSRTMYKKPVLSSIPEDDTEPEPELAVKWVPKKKHEVLKAKYKCLKKLFQIYDASVIGILPDSYEDYDDSYNVNEPERRRSRKKRSHRTKTDACAGTNECDITLQSEDKASITTAVMRDLNLKCSCSTQILPENPSQIDLKSSKIKLDKIDSKNSSTCSRECECTQTAHFNNYNYNPFNNFNPNIMNPKPYIVEKHKPTRFQLLLQRLFGIRREKISKSYFLPNGHIYAASDNNLSHYGERRRRKGLRLRRIRGPKKSQSDVCIADLNSPAILTFVQSIQRSCLMDTTARHCPIAGCQSVFYGIINYNDHLNMCHFSERKFACHYCHEGFEREYEKLSHENEHLGINRLNSMQDHHARSSTSTAKSHRVSITQTDPDVAKTEVPDEKLKKIVSFFDKLADNDHVLTEIKKNRFSDSNIQGSKQESQSESDSSSDKRTVSCGNLGRRVMRCRPTASDVPTDRHCDCAVKCHFCGESFAYRRQLNLHVDLEHRMQNKYPKFHSCAGITSIRQKPHACATQMQLEAGKINVQSSDIRSIRTTSSSEDYDKSELSLSCDPSTNIVYYDSSQAINSSKFNHFANKVRNGVSSYKWEPGTKIIRV